MHAKPFRFTAVSTIFLTLCIFLATVFGVLATTGFAQTATATLTGTVTDPKGLAMTSVSVQVRNADTGVEHQPVMTNDSGIYLIPLLPPGSYEVIASQAGFASVQHKGVTLQVGQTVRVDIEMPVAVQQSLVTVTTDVPALETEKTEQSQNVSENLVSNLPVSSRRWEQFALLTPGVNLDGGSGGMSFHGINSSYNNNSVDGANNNSSYNASSRGGSSDGYVYSGDSIQEFQVSSSSFSAELGQSAGGAVNAVTKSGTSQFHGDLFYNGRTPSLNALDPLSKANAAINGQIPTQPVHQQHQWGGSAGGPLMKDKLFFFVTSDGYRKVNPLTTNTQQLSPSIRDLVCPNPSTVSAAQCQASKDFVFRNIVGNFPRYLRQDIELVKLDYQLNQSNHVNAVTNIRDWKTATDPTSVNGGTSYLQSRFVIANWSMVLGSNKVNEVRYQWGKDLSFNAVNRLNGVPQVQLSNLFTYGLNNGSTFTNEIRNQVSDNFSWTKGTHSFKFGVDVNFIHDLARSSSNSGGLYKYSSAVALPASVTASYLNSAGATVNGCTTLATAQTANTIFCDWLVDAFGFNTGATKGQHWTSYTQIADARYSTPPATYGEDFTNDDYAGYVQDTWKARPNLTVNLGLRYDVQVWQPPLFPSTVLPGLMNIPILAYYTSTAPNDYGGIQPRVGIAWNFRKSTVIRAGGGIFFAKTTGTAWKTVLDGAGEPEINCTTAKCVTPLLFPNILVNEQDVGPAPPFTSPTLTAAQQPLTPAVLNPTATVCPCGSRGIDPTAVRPRTYEFQVGIERQLPANMNLSVSYIFTRGVHLPTTNDTNIGANFDPNNTAGGPNGTTVTKTYDVVDSKGVTQLTTTVPLFFQRIDSRTGPIISQLSVVNSTYNGMVISVRKPMSHGFEVLANYTLSKSTDDGQGSSNNGGESFLGSDGVINPFDQRAEQSYSATDARNRFTGSLVWQPRFGKNMSNRAARQLLSGWSMSSTVLATNGGRYNGTVSSTASPSVKLGAVTYAGLDGGMSAVSLSSTTDPIGGRIAWIPRNTFRLPNLYNVDLRLSKQFSIRERFAIEIRGEAFNLFNSVLVQGVSANAYTYTQPGATGSAAAACPSTGVGTALTPHVNTCMTPVSSFQSISSTSGNLLGPRQLQAGVRFSF